MKREIKFRGKRIDNGEWVFGSLAIDAETGTPYIVGEFLGNYDGWMQEEVDPETVGEFVCGDLYEGDIAELWCSDQVSYGDDDSETIINPTVCLLRWGGADYPAFEFYSKRKTSHNTQGWFWDSITEEFNSFSDEEMNYKIIGNIHDNPELLEA